MIPTQSRDEFDPQRDKLFHLAMKEAGGEVELRELPFTRHGPSDAWLMSEVFGLRQPRSLEAEQAIAEAEALQLQAQPSQEDVQRVSDRLVRCLAEHDAFWPLWLYFAEQHGVKL